MKQILKNKWYRYWICLGLFILLFIWYVVVHINDNDINNAILQFGAILIPLIAALIIMGQNNEQIEKATKLQLDHLQQLTDKQINTLQESTNKQIQHYAEETNKIIDELIDNSILLGEILKVDIEQQLISISQKIGATQNELTKLRKSWDTSISHDDKHKQINTLENAIATLKRYHVGLSKRYKALKEEGFID